ncbi:MAG: ribonuclease H-like YkuK family protein [Patescibacteria group bacterium]
MYFNTSLGLKLNTQQVISEIIRFMQEDDKRRYKIIIGTDSARSEDNTADFVTAIIVHRVGNGGRYFWRRIDEGRLAEEKAKFHTLRDRIINEVLLSLEAAKEVLVILKDFGASNFDFEIHADVGENGETKTMIAEVVGMIRAYNFEARTKPNSYGASKVADRHV